MLRIFEQRVMFPRSGQFSDAVREQLAGGYQVAARQQVMQAVLEQVEMTTEARGEDEVLTARLAIIDVASARELAQMTAQVEELVRTNNPLLAPYLPFLRAVVAAVRGAEGLKACEVAPPLPGAWLGGADEDRPVALEDDPLTPGKKQLVVAVTERELRWDGAAWETVPLRLHLAEGQRAGGTLVFARPSGETLVAKEGQTRLVAPGIFRVIGKGVRA